MEEEKAIKLAGDLIGSLHKRKYSEALHGHLRLLGTGGERSISDVFTSLSFSESSNVGRPDQSRYLILTLRLDEDVLEVSSERANACFSGNAGISPYN